MNNTKKTKLTIKDLLPKRKTITFDRGRYRSISDDFGSDFDDAPTREEPTKEFTRIQHTTPGMGDLFDV